MIKEARWSGWVWVGECFLWYRPTRVVPDQRPLNGRCPSRGLDFCDDRVCLCVCLQIYLQTYTWGANFCELKNLVVDAVPDLPVAVVTFDGDMRAHHKVWGLCGCSAALYQAALAICYDSCDLILPMIKLAWWCNDRMSEVTSLIFS